MAVAVEKGVEVQEESSMSDSSDHARSGSGKRPDPGLSPEFVVDRDPCAQDVSSPRGRPPTRTETRRRFRVMSALALDALRASRSYVLHYRAERGAE